MYGLIFKDWFKFIFQGLIFLIIISLVTLYLLQIGWFRVLMLAVPIVSIMSLFLLDTLYGILKEYALKKLISSIIIERYPASILQLPLIDKNALIPSPSHSWLLISERDSWEFIHSRESQYPFEESSPRNMLIEDINDQWEVKNQELLNFNVIWKDFFNSRREANAAVQRNRNAQLYSGARI